ncbi:hypothetical protein A2438_08155 [candidate division WOR-1 bacterium RIFOXYC2_FULL_46_14]|uniref:Uncharacterized protein n=1 Tax=candidate division WOR-1 bacterium RIFOXYC2_FULL_46_14 TaxID=1802587 RepID=A0A1F4U5F9_UNCSA|nr:MAG: hypothetical protein A2438_08155 [candidate division WOR-1 bacterium RIFOXYC2_FULL_46_14]
MGKGIEELDYNKIDRGLIAAAYKGYVASRVNDRKTSADVDRELAEKLGNPPNFNKIKRELAALLACAAHAEINSYYVQHNDDGLKYDIDLDKVLDKGNFLEKYAVVITRLLSKQKDNNIFAMPKVLNKEEVEKLYLIHLKVLQEEKAPKKHAPGEALPIAQNSP